MLHRAIYRRPILVLLSSLYSELHMLSEASDRCWLFDNVTSDSTTDDIFFSVNPDSISPKELNGLPLSIFHTLQATKRGKQALQSRSAVCGDIAVGAPSLLGVPEPDPSWDGCCVKWVTTASPIRMTCSSHLSGHILKDLRGVLDTSERTRVLCRRQSILRRPSLNPVKL
jgi:hypothetical protein